MKLSNIRLNAATSILTLLIIGAPLSAQQQSQAATEWQEHEEHSRPSIEGSWIFTITRTDGTVFTAFQSYTAGGVALGSGSIQTPPTSGLHGTWKQKGPNLFVHSFDLFIFGFNGGDAQNMLRNKIQLHFIDQGELLVGTGTAVLCDVKGDSCFGIGGISLLGKRIAAE
jgi:hypothetical protein